ncbi:MAG: type I-E CRISPR-associated protein Cse1/CasA [Phycisphaerales bacterium]|nr:type I-E CRISPR-associated protein Cse1/CasA [Phycisphaerales bacterium]
MGLADDTSYNLLDEGWIPILYAGGEFQKVGIRSVLKNAGKIRQIAASNPMDRVALLRFLMAVLLWCKPDLSDNDRAQLSSADGIPDEWLKKLDEHKAKFNLLGESERFYQDSAVKSKKARPIADLLVEFPGEDSVNHMHHVVHGSYGFCPACCAQGILRLSVWASANKYYPASVNPGSAAYAIRERENLLLTLAANLPEATASTDDAPWLSNTPPTSPGTVARLAWRPRKLWLNVARDTGACANCGNEGVLVESLCNEGGWLTPTTKNQDFTKEVETELKKMGYKPKGKDRKNKTVAKLLKNLPVIRKCRIGKLQKLCRAGDAAAQSIAQPPKSEAHQIAEMFNRLASSDNNEKCIKALTQKAIDDEKKQLSDEDTKVKKFWTDDPLLLEKNGDPLSLPGLNRGPSAHASKFWRDALSACDTAASPIVAIGPVVNKFIFQDAVCIEVPDSSAKVRAELSAQFEGQLSDQIKEVTANPSRQHPEIAAAVDMLTPDREACTRQLLTSKDTGASNEDFLHHIYDSLVAQVISSTNAGSVLRRRAATIAAKTAVKKVIKKLIKSARKKSKAAGKSNTTSTEDAQVAGGPEA